MTRRACSLVGGAVLVLTAPGCRSRARVDARAHEGTWWTAPSDDVGEPCADVGDLRVCWDARSGARVSPRPVPPFAAPTPPGFRCVGRGPTRACAPRALSAGPFVCTPAVCRQAYPRQPDDGEWTCADFAGATVCVGSEAPAGVSVADGPSGWVCGPRRPAAAARDRLGTRVCVDFSPDFPEGRAAALRCRWSYEHGVTRECAPEPGAHVLGDGCDAAHPCVDGATCVASRCVPGVPAPSCWLDDDCGGAVCRFGSCAGTAR